MLLKYKKNQRKGGYTIIETMIAVSLFLVVVMSGMGALLNANLLHQKSQSVRSILDNMSFIMEDMSRNLRIGYGYRCMSSFSLTNIGTPQSCASGKALAFENAAGNPAISTDQWAYTIEIDSVTGKYNIWKSTSVGALEPLGVQVNPTEVTLTAASGFSVLGAEPFDVLDPDSSDKQQPLVIIKLVGEINDTKNNVKTPFSLQTSVSQRILDR